MRNELGSLFPFIASSAAVIVFLSTLFVNVFIYALAQQKTNSACEAAALAAAADLSRIVVKDPHFGYISLTDWPAGTATKNPAGEPMPVIGINTLTATCRANLLIAAYLHNETMLELARTDAEACRNACKLLNEACNSALDPQSAHPQDRDGRPVNTYEHARRSFLATSPFTNEYNQVSEFKLSLGYLDTSTTSATELPGSPQTCQVTEAESISGQYNAFVDIPARGTSFFFAGLGTRTSLCSSARFKKANNKEPKICSAVCVNAAISNQSPMAKSLEKQGPAFPGLTLYGRASALPGANKDLCNPPLFFLGFPNGIPRKSWTIAQILEDKGMAISCPELQKATDGDFPIDASAMLSLDTTSKQLSFAQLSAKALYDWLRASHSKASIESVLAKLNETLENASDPNAEECSLVLCVDRTGKFSVQPAREFSCQTIHDQQNYAVAYDVEIAQKKWTVVLKDQVSRLGEKGGKHSGRTLQDKEVEGLVESIYPHDGMAVLLQFAAPH